MEQEIKNKYLAKFDELNILASDLMVKPSDEEAVYWFDDTLIDAYIEGFLGAGAILGYAMSGIDYGKMRNAIQYEYDGESIQDKLIEYYNSLDQESLNRLLEDEYHRVYTTGQLDGANAINNEDVSIASPNVTGTAKDQNKAKIKGEIMKKWVTVGDDKVRKDHQKLDGVTIPLSDTFKVAGDEALAPGGFKSARLNANCRCMLDFVYNG